jgi:molybdopterin-guanine dinucleotide biosynthesis protein B
MPIISIVGRSGSGKTTLMERLIPELRSRGYRVATVKHTPSGLSFDRPGKDSWRHIQAGSKATVVSSPDEVVIIRPTSQDTPLIEIVRFLGEDYDLILTEGFKQEDAPKIETHRKIAGPPLKDVKRLIGVVTDEILDTKARQFSFEDSKRLADLLEEGFIKPQKERICLYVNNSPIPLTSFPKEIISSVLLAMASCLRGVGEITSLQIFLKRE